MFIIETGEQSGINPFFPLITGRKSGRITVMELSSYLTRINILIALNLLVLSQFLSTIFIDWPGGLGLMFALCAIGLVIFRTLATPTVTIRRTQVVAVAAAPWQAWIEHVSHFSALLAGTLTVSLSTSGSMQVAAALITGALALLVALPLFNTIWYHRSKNTESQAVPRI